MEEAETKEIKNIQEIKNVQEKNVIQEKSIIQKIEAFIRCNQMIERGDHLIVGVSGGADSICLLLVLLRLREVFGHQVSVVHVNHGIRGDAAEKDAEFVRSFCEERGIKCHICRCKVPEYARMHGMSEEEAGRAVRYEAFREEKKKYPARKVKIAVAHHLQDHAETMLFHLVRGTGIRGLAAIVPVCGDIIRPLLHTSRQEIEAYLALTGQDYCIDATNETDAYSRNKIRHQVLPALCEINSCAAQHMYQTARQLQEIADYLSKQAAAAQELCCRIVPDAVWIEKEKFLGLDTVVQREMLHQLLGMLAGSRKDLTREHICQVLELFDKQNGRRVKLPYGMEAVRVYSGVEIHVVKNVKNAEKESANKRDYLEKQFSFRIIEPFSEHMSQISKKKYTKCFDYDKIKYGLCVRHRQPGDYLTIDASGSRQKLKKYLVNEKIPVKEREQLLLLADGSHIMWIVGYRISSDYKVSEQSRRILEVTFCGGKEDERTDSGDVFRGRSECKNCGDCCTD